MQLKIKTLKGDIFSIGIDPAASFLEVKQKIHEIRKLPIHLQKLVYKGKAMENHHLLTQIGVREEDTLVLMQVLSKKVNNHQNVRTVEKEKEKESAPNEEVKKEEIEAKVKQLENMGFQRQKSVQVLQQKGGNLQEALAVLSGNSNNHIQNMIKQEIQKALQDNQGVVSQALENEGQIRIDFQSLINTLGDQNEGLKNILLNNPDALNNFFMAQADFDEEENQGEEVSQEIQEMELTEEEQQSIEKLISLGFEREDVIQVFFACDKDQQIAANMLFERQANGDFDEHIP